MDATIIDKNCCVVRWSLLGEFDGGFPSGSQQRWDCKPVQVTKPGAIKRLIHRYLERRKKRRALRLGGAENEIVAPYEGRRWCDATERELIGDITNIHGSHV
jgi:hypothetical protein